MVDRQIMRDKKIIPNEKLVNHVMDFKNIDKKRAEFFFLSV